MENKKGVWMNMGAKRIIAFFSLIVLCITLVSCKEDLRTDEEKINDRITEFVEMYNRGDAEGMFDCFEPRTRKKFRTIYKIAGNLFKLIPYVGSVIDFSDIFSLSFTVTDEEILKIRVKEIIPVDETNATVVAEIGYNFEFMGYSDTDEILEVYITLIKEKEDWYLKDLTEDINIVNVKDYVKIVVTERSDFCNDVSLVAFTKNGQERRGVINRDGVIIYSQSKSDNNTINLMGHGYCFAKDETGSFVVDKNGETVKVNVDYDKVLASGGGGVLLYKTKNSITHIERLFGVLDCYGEMAVPFVDIPQFDEAFSYSYDGEGVFIARNGEFGTATTIGFFDSNSGSVYKIDGERVLHGGFECGMSYGTRGSTITYYGNGKVAELPDYYRITTSGTVGDCDAIVDVLNGGALGMNGGYYRVIKSDRVFTYDSYGLEYIEEITCYGEYTLVRLSGVNNVSFFTVLDGYGKEMFEPVPYVDDVRISDKAVVYKVGTGNDGSDVYEAVNYGGGILISKEQGFSFIGDFSDGISTAVYNGRTYYVDLNGAIVLKDLKESP